MTSKTMSDLKVLARFIALVALMFWCVGLVSAQQKPVPPQHGPISQHKAALPSHGTPSLHKPVRPLVGEGQASRPVAHRGVKMRMARPEHRKPMVAQHEPVKKPVEVPKPAVEVPAVPTAAALAAQTPMLPETGHGRDPFEALIRPTDPNAGRLNLPPGIAGLQVATVRLQGMVKTSDGMVAVVANPEDSVYFLHDGDHIYDGVVEKIGIDEITFKQESKDAFGRTVDRDVAKRLYPIAGDEQ
jgi:hypothetical protein